MINAIKTFLNGYRAAGIKEIQGRQGVGFMATLVKDGKELGEIFDNANGGCVCIRLKDSADEQALIAYAKEKYPDLEYEQDGAFINALIDYEMSVKKIKAKAAKCLMVADESQVDENGVPTGYSIWKLEPTPENKAKVLAKEPNTKFLNDELAGWETLKAARPAK